MLGVGWGPSTPRIVRIPAGTCSWGCDVGAAGTAPLHPEVIRAEALCSGSGVLRSARPLSPAVPRHPQACPRCLTEASREVKVPSPGPLLGPHQPCVCPQAPPPVTGWGPPRSRSLTSLDPAFPAGWQEGSPGRPGRSLGWVTWGQSPHPWDPRGFDESPVAPRVWGVTCVRDLSGRRAHCVGAPGLQGRTEGQSQPSVPGLGGTVGSLSLSSTVPSGCWGSQVMLTAPGGVAAGVWLASPRSLRPSSSYPDPAPAAQPCPRVYVLAAPRPHQPLFLCLQVLRPGGTCAWTGRWSSSRTPSRWVPWPGGSPCLLRDEW